LGKPFEMSVETKFLQMLKASNIGEVADDQLENPTEGTIKWASVQLENQAQDFDEDEEHTPDRISFLTLPLGMPEHSVQSNICIIREDDCRTFNRLVAMERAVLMGNPGIGKSAYQRKQMLFMVFVLICEMSCSNVLM